MGQISKLVMGKFIALKSAIYSFLNYSIKGQISKLRSNVWPYGGSNLANYVKMFYFVNY